MNWFTEFIKAIHQTGNELLIEDAERVSTALRLLVEVGRCADKIRRRHNDYGIPEDVVASIHERNLENLALVRAIEAALVNPDCKALLEGEDEV